MSIKKAPKLPGWQLLKNAAQAVVNTPEDQLTGDMVETFGLNLLLRTDEQIPDKHKSEVLIDVIKASVVISEFEFLEEITNFLLSQYLTPEDLVAALQLHSEFSLYPVPGNPDDSVIRHRDYEVLKKWADVSVDVLAKVAAESMASKRRGCGNLNCRECGGGQLTIEDILMGSQVLRVGKDGIEDAGTLGDFLNNVPDFLIRRPKSDSGDPKPGDQKPGAEGADPVTPVTPAGAAAPGAGGEVPPVTAK